MALFKRITSDGKAKIVKDGEDISTKPADEVLDEILPDQDEETSTQEDKQ